MISWNRQGDYYVEKLHHTALRNSVVFNCRSNNERRPVTVKRINIFHYSNDDIFISLMSSYFRKNEFYDVCLRLIQSDIYNFDREKDEIRIKLNSPDTFKQLIAVFNYFNDEIIEFPSILILELQQIWDNSFKENKKSTDIYQHVIPENGMTNKFVNPAKKDSRELLKLLYKKEKDISEKKYHQLLVGGEDPNQKDISGYTTALRLTLALTSNIYLKMGINYGGKPFAHEDEMCESVVERVKKCYDYPSAQFPKSFWKERLDLLLTNPFSQPQKSLSPIRLEKIDYSSNENQVIKNIYFNNMAIKTITTRAFDVSLEDKNNVLFPHFKAVFKPGRDQKIRAIFEEGLFGKTKFIELIYDQRNPKKIIGYNAFEMIMDDKQNDDFKDRLTLHVIFSALDPNYRRCGLIPLTTIGLAFAISGIYPSLVTGLCCTAISIATFSVLQSFILFPKYKTPASRKFVREKLAKTIYDDSEYEDDMTMKSIVKEDVSVYDSYQKLTSNPFTNCLYYAMLGLTAEEMENPTGKTEGLGVFLYMLVDFLNYINYNAMLNTFGINFKEEIDPFTEAVKPFICKLLNKNPENKPRQFWDSKDLFWKNKKTAVCRMEEHDNTDASVKIYSRL